MIRVLDGMNSNIISMIIEYNGREIHPESTHEQMLLCGDFAIFFLSIITKLG